MAESTNTTTTSSKQFISKAQANALKSAIRAAATTNPKGRDHALRCREIGMAVCSKVHAASVHLIPADAFQEAVQTIYAHARPEREKGPLEARLFACKEAMEDTLALLLEAKRDIGAFRRQVEMTLLVPFKDAMVEHNKDNTVLGCNVQDSLDCMLTMSMLNAEHELDRIHEVLNITAHRLLAVGRALDNRFAVSGAPCNVTIGAD